MVGRGTRVCQGLFGKSPDGKSLDKEKFLIFDHWGNFEYFELNHDDEEPRQVKSLAQKLFERRIAYAEEALKQGAVDEFNAMIQLVKQDIDSLNDNTIAINKDKTRHRAMHWPQDEREKHSSKGE